MAKSQGRGSAEWMVVGVLVAVHCSSLLASAATLTVGDTQGWTIGPNYATWAAAQTFTIGDVLFFSYTKGSHNVVEVGKAGYDACSATNAIATYTEGNTNVTLTTSGTHYFLCSFPGHCTSGMKLAVTLGAGATPTPAPSTSVGTPPPTPTASVPPPTAATPSSSSPPTPTSTAPVPSPPTTPTPTPTPTSTAPVSSPASAPTPTPTSTPSSAPTPLSPSPGSTPTPPSSPSSTSTTPGSAPSPPQSPPSAASSLHSAASIFAVLLCLSTAFLAL